MRDPGSPRLFDRIRAFGLFLIAIVYYLLAEQVAGFAAGGLARGDWFEPIYRGILLFLLLLGYGVMGYVFQRQSHPLTAMGLLRRPTALREFGLGVALGWGMMVMCVLSIAIGGHMRLTFWTGARQFELLALDLIVLGLAALLEEVAFRGYPFQRLIEAIGPAFATLLMAILFALRHLQNPDATPASTLFTVFAGWLFAVAYLRTRALWLPWGLHFAWNAAMGVLFGLPISGLRAFSPVIEANTRGPFWITGGGYGPEGSLVAVIVILVGIFVLFKITREYAWNYAQPVIIAGGIAVDIDAAARRQHDAAMESPAAPAPPQFVQIIAPVGSVPAAGGPPIGVRLPSDDELQS
ncbi:MAG TPA: type II CAAX endopeptidase family protein [Acidisarcina sp.]